MKHNYLIALDQGTSSSRSLLFDEQLQLQASAQQEFPQSFPQSGWVEHDAEELLNSSLSTLRQVLSHNKKGHIAALGITNQRETALLWHRDSGRAIYPAIVWQDRRGAALCKKLREENNEAMVQQRSGLLLDPYFSASKISWMLDNVPHARQWASAGKLLMGTVDSWLIWNLTGRKVHATDASNASRTALYNIHSGEWDEELLRLFRIPAAILPQVYDSAAEFGHCQRSLFGAALPIRGVAGDQQAAAIGQACFSPGMLKITYGTGAFAILNTGTQAVHSRHRLLCTIAYQLQGRPCYALEGSIFVAGAAVQWLRDGLAVIDQAKQAQSLASSSDADQRIYLVPAFVGLGAPYWKPHVRGAIFGLRRDSGVADLARAALESVAYQSRDLMTAMHKDWPENSIKCLRVDGGMSQSEWTMQFLADLLNIAVERPVMAETTALGAAYLAALQSAICPEPEVFAEQWRAEKSFVPQLDADSREACYRGWQQAVQQCIGDQ